MANFWYLFLLETLTEKCYNEYFVNYNFLDVPCMTTTASRGLGIGIIAGSTLVKIPQILKILNNQSGEGINVYGVYLELFAITANFAYSYVMDFPFSAWGEGIFLSIQTAMIATLVLHFGGATVTAASFVASYAGLVILLVSGHTPIDVLWILQATNVPIIVIAKSIQIMTNYKNGSTGQLSAVTLLLLFGGSVARIFTSFVETGDFIIILTYCVSTIANGAIVCQLLWYWNANNTKNQKKKIK